MKTIEELKRELEDLHVPLSIVQMRYERLKQKKFYILEQIENLEFPKMKMPAETKREIMKLFDACKTSDRSVYEPIHAAIERLEMDEDGNEYATEDYNVPPEFDVDTFAQDIKETYRRHGAYLYVTNSGDLKILEYDVERPEFSQLERAVYLFNEGK